LPPRGARVRSHPLKEAPLQRTTAFSLIAFVVANQPLGTPSEGADSLLAQQALPTPLTAEEERSPAARAIARRFNPAMAFATDDHWPVQVRYAWQDGADLIGHVGDERFVAVPHHRLELDDWSTLPHADLEGRPITYHLDSPGDDREGEDGVTGWRRRFRSLCASAPSSGPALDPATARFRPTQYAHVFWFNRQRGLLGIQYWFYYPYNEWINRHEGDWEHINVIVSGPQTLDDPAAFQVYAFQFFFHAFSYEPREVIRVAGRDEPGDHVMVFAGGRGRWASWGGEISGGSYPLPAVYTGAGWSAPFAPDDDTTAPRRLLHADEFDVILLPEPDRLDGRADPALSWLKLPVLVGQPHVTRNPPGYRTFGWDRPPPQPGLRRDWNARQSSPLWRGRVLGRTAFVLPSGWTAVQAPRDLPRAALPTVATTP
jgi:hypothetical protein